MDRCNPTGRKQHRLPRRVRLPLGHQRDLRVLASSGAPVVLVTLAGCRWQIRPVEYQVTKAALEDAALICPTGQDGPFYRSKRNVHNTVFAGMPSMLESGRDNRIYGVHLGSLPPGARSYYDSIGDRYARACTVPRHLTASRLFSFSWSPLPSNSVVWSVRYDLGMITYVGNSMEALTGEAHHTSVVCDKCVRMPVTAVCRMALARSAIMALRLLRCELRQHEFDLT